ncbi:MAG: efflux RND transporter periplasmic adaptor subunit [Thermoanaerobaculia bacterium]|nr:efflux RND transporter periplasmic adaptor subunit [Thermoanaerobaculia bacterium]
MTRTKKILVIGIPVLIAIGVAATMWSGADKKFPVVTVQKAARTDLRSLVTATGKTEAQRKVDLSANVMGQIVNLAVREGDVVKKGDFLLQIDLTQRRATAVGAEESLKALFFDRDAARAQADEAKKTFERSERSFKDQIIPQADVDRARAAFEAAEANWKAGERRIEQARANLAGARDELSKTKMLSPIDGVITALPVEEGEVAVIGTMNNAGTKLMTISDMSTVEAVMEVDETDIPSVKVGQTAEVRIDAFGERKFEGIVTEVGSSPISSLTGSTDAAVNFEVRIQLKDLPTTMRPGFSCSADILTGTAAGVLAVPIQALVVREKDAEGEAKPEEEEGVYVLKTDGSKKTAVFSAVTPGMTGETQVEIQSGLSDGDEVITGPFKALREIKDGDRVRLEEPKKEGSKSDKKAD